MSSSPRNENDGIEQGLAASPPSTQNAASSRRFTDIPTQTNLPPADATTARPTLWAGISPMDAAAADYAAVARSSAVTMPATAPSAGSELTRVWSGSTADNAATIPSDGPELIDEGEEPPPPTAKMEAMLDAPPAASASLPPPPSGIEVIDNDTGPAPPVAMTDAATMDRDPIVKRRVGGAKAVGLELMHDYVGPLPPNAAEGGAADSYLKKMAVSSNIAASGTPLETPNELTLPTPFNFARSEEDRPSELPPNAAARGAADSSGSRLKSPPEIMPPTPLSPPINNNSEDEESPTINGNSEDEESPPINDNDDEHNDIDPDGADAIVNQDEASQIIQASVRPILQPGPNNDSTPFIPEAMLVADGDDQVIIATRLERERHCLKQRRTKLFLFLICLLVMIFAIVFGVERWKNRSATSSPSFLPTTAPSSSFAPSYAPSSCAYKLSSNKQEVEMPLGDSFYPEMAVDGRNMVVVAQDSRSTATYTIFYSLENDEWIIKHAFQEDFYSDDMELGYTVALSGKRAMVGIPEARNGTGAVSAYEQNQQGFWENVEEPFNPEETPFELLGVAVGIDGDLACVGDVRAVNLFLRDGNKWVQIDRIDGLGFECFISGDTIVINGYDFDSGSFLLQLYKYDKDQGKAVPLQDPLPAGGGSSITALSHDYLVYLDFQHEVTIYRREETNQTFTFHQQLSTSDTDTWAIGRPKLDQGILVIGGIRHTHIFSEQYGYWNETITLYQSYDDYQLSGRNLVAASLNGVYSFNIEDCAPMPTQMPTKSIAPTTCYLIEITIVYDQLPWDTSWKLYRIGANGDDSEIKSYEKAAFGDTSYAESICLQEGEYEFIMYDSSGNGICCSLGEGHYSVTSNGALIVEGGDFGLREATRFSLPFFPAAPSAVPSISQTPSSSLSPSMSGSPSTTPSSSSSPSMSQPPSMAPSITPPSMSPTLSLSPTETCFSIEINVFTDDPGQTRWAISTFVTVDGIQEKNLVYDSSSQIELQVDGKLYNATHIRNSATGTSVVGVLCDCGVGTSQCECQGEVCIIERGDNYFYEKIANCGDAGGLAAIIYNNVDQPIISEDWTLGEGISANIPAAIISQTDGQYLVEHGLGEVVAMTTSSSLQFNANTLNSRRVCLPEGGYEFTIYDSLGDGICCLVGEGRYNVTTLNGALIAQGGEFEFEETTRFSLPFVPS